MKKNGNWQIILVSILMVVLILTGTVAAYMFRRSGIKENHFTPAKVDCYVHEVTDTPVTQKTSITVQNIGIIDAYIRVRFVSYWVDSDGNIVAKPSVMPDIALADGWIKGENDTYYCKNKVSKNNYTAEMLSEPILLVAEDGYFQVIDVFAEAIQAQPSKAVTESWGVSVDADGVITGISN